MTTRLVDLVIDRVDFVDKGANPGAHITLFKRDTTMADKNEATDAEVQKRMVYLETQVADAEAKAKEATEQLGKSVERIATLESQSRDLVEKSEHAEFVAKAGQYNSIMKADDFAPILRKIHKTLSEDERKVWYQWLGSLNTVAKTSALFQEIGVGGSPEGGSAYEKLEKMAAEIRKAEPTLTPEKAFNKAVRSDAGAKLYDEYLKEAK